MSTKDPGPQHPPFFMINLVSCVLGVLVILWFAFGVEEQNSRAQMIFEWMLKHSTPIITLMIGLMVFILVWSFWGVKSLKDREKNNQH